MLRKFDNIPVTTTLERTLAKLKIDPDDDEDAALVAGLFETAKEIARPKALYRECYVEEISGKNVRIDGRDFESDVVAMTLRDVHRVFAYVCTCGAELEEWAKGEKDFILRLWLDMIKEMFLRDAIAFLRGHIQSAYQIEKLSSVDPGSGNADNWPIAQMSRLFALIGDVRGEIGVGLSGSFMSPVKSTSGLLFPSETEFVNCALCGRENCSGRRAEFDSELYARTFI